MELLAALGALIAVVFNLYCFWRWFDHMARMERAAGDVARRLDKLHETVESSTKVIAKAIAGD